MIDWIDMVKKERDNGINRALDQSQHESVNARYPGLTLQTCDLCGDETGRCEEDELDDEEGNIYCENCYKEHLANK